MLSERIDGQPLHAIVGQGPGGEPDLARVGVAAAFGDLVEDAVDLDFGIGMVAVRRLRARDAHQAHAFGGHGTLHHVAGLLLRIDLAVVFHGGDVVEVDGVIGGVVEVPELLFPLGRHFLELEELLGLAESGAGSDGRPESGKVRAESPGGRAAHAEAAHQGAVLVDGVLAFHGVERFEEIDLAGESIGIAEAAVEVEHDGVARGELAGRPLARRSGN